MSRPVLSIEPTPVDRIMDIISYLALALLIGLPLIYYKQLPETVPHHFNAAGEADAYGGKSVLIFLPLIGLLLFAGLTFLERIPHHHNFPKEVTEENAESMYRASVRLLKSLKMIVTGAFVYIVWRTIQTALGQADGLGAVFLPVFLLLTLGGIAYFAFRIVSS